jgi:dihydrofolate reductase
MRKLVAGFASSVDGYMEGPNGEYDWILMDKEMDFAEQAKRYDAYFLGRKSYEKIAGMSSKPTPGITHYVFSNTLTQVRPPFSLISGDVKAAVERIKRQEGKDIALFGGASLLASLLDLGLVDEIIISVIPVLLGQGKPMVSLLQDKIWLTLLSSRTYANGTVQVHYASNRS